MAMAMATPAYSLPSSNLHKHSSPTSTYFQFRPLTLIVTSKLSVGSFNTNHNSNAKPKFFSKGPESTGFELGISSGCDLACTHVTVCFAAGGDNITVNGNEGGGKEGGDLGKGGETLNLVSEADLLKKKARKLRRRRRRLLQKRKLRKKGSWPPSKMAKLKKV